MESLKRSSRWLIYVGILVAGIIIFILLEPLNMGVEADRTAKESSPVVAVASSERIRLVLDEYPNASHAYIYAAETNGYFREQGLSIDIAMPSSNMDSLAAVGQGQAHLAIARGPEVVLAQEAELPVVSIAAIIRRPLDYLAVEQDSPIHSPLHLIDKRIAYNGTSYYPAIIRQMMIYAKLDHSKVQLVEMSAITADSALFEEQTYDAVFGMNVARDRLIIEKNDRNIRMIDPLIYDVPAYYDRVIIANKQAVEDNEELYARIWTALAKGQRYVIEHPEQAIEMIMSKESARNPLNQEIEHESLRLLLPLMESHKEPFGSQEKNVWEDTVDWLEDMDMLGSDIKGEDMFVDVTVVD